MSKNTGILPSRGSSFSRLRSKLSPRKATESQPNEKNNACSKLSPRKTIKSQPNEKSNACSNLSPRKTTESQSNEKNNACSKLSTRKTTESQPKEKNNACSELQRVFNYFDENKDGKISPLELQSCVRTVGKGDMSLEEAEAIVKSSDMDGDVLLGIEEFECLMESSCGDERDSELKDAFEMYVMEGSGGVITPVSLKRMLGRLGDTWSLEECEAMIRSFDVNGDGVLSFDEFRIMMA